MKFKVNDNCIACGLCVSMCPDVFEMADNGMAKVKHQPDNETEIALAADAKISCPVQAIEEE